MKFWENFGSCSQIFRTGENPFYKKKFSVSNFQTLINFFYDLHFRRRRKKLIFFFLNFAARLVEQSSTIFSFIGLIFGPKGISFYFNNFDYLLIEKINFIPRRTRKNFFSGEFVENRIFARSFFHNLFLELEIYFEDKLIFPLFQNSLLKVLLKTYQIVFRLFDDQSYHEHLLSCLKSKFDFIGDNFGFFQKEVFLKGNQFSFIDEVTNFYELIRLRIKYRKNNLVKNKLQIFPNLRKDIRSNNIFKPAKNKIIIKKEKKNFSLDLTLFFEFKRRKFKNNFRKTPIWFKFQNSQVYSFNYDEYSEKFSHNLKCFLRTLRLNWSTLSGKHSHYWGHKLRCFFDFFSREKKMDIFKIYFFLFNFFLSNIKTSNFCIKKMIIKVLQFFDWFSQKTIFLFLEIIVLCSKKSMFFLKWKKLTQTKPFFRVCFVLSQFSEKIKMSRAIHYGFLEIPKNFFLRKNIYFKKKANYIYLKHLNKVIFSEKNLLNNKKNSLHFENIFYRSSFLSFSLFLFSILIPTTPLSSQIIFLEKYGTQLRFLADDDAKKNTGLKTLLILKSGFPFFDVSRFFERLNSCHLIDLCFLGRVIIDEVFLDENNLWKLDVISRESNSILKENKSLAFVEKKFLKIYIQKLKVEKKNFIKNGYQNLKKAKIFFLTKIQIFESSIFEGINIQLNKIFLIWKNKIFFLDKFYHIDFLVSLFKFFSSFVNNFIRQRKICFGSIIKTKKIEYLYM
jgi:hypothetical protein